MRRLGVFLVAAALIGLVAVSVAAGGKGGTDRPFKATYTGALTFVVPDGCPPDCGAFNTVPRMTGQATHLGRVRMHFSHYPYDPTRPGRMIITAANGDELHGTYTYPGFGEDFPITVTGGTGRFTAATGRLVNYVEFVPQFEDPPCRFEGCLNPFVPWPAWGTLTGTISY